MTSTFPKIQTYADDIAKRIVSGEERYDWYGILCIACKDIRTDEEFCKMHRLASNLTGCDICQKEQA